MNTNSPKELVISRTFTAPRQKVWDAFTKAEHLQHWWGPKGFGMKNITLDFRPGGQFHYCMVTPDGKEMWGKFEYQDVQPTEKIVFLNMFSDAQGGVTPNPWIPNWPLKVMNTATFEEKDGKTTITLRGGPVNPTPEQQKLFEQNQKNMQDGFKGTWEQLDAYLTKM